MALQIIKPDSKEQAIKNFFKVFLAGSIEMGTAENWQEKLIEDFEEFNITFFNPRRDDWDSSWEQKSSNKGFNYQVNWELDHLEKCDFIFLYFSPETKSPISLLELGLFAHHNKMIVCCPEGFWRKGNIEIVCQRLNIPLYISFEEAKSCLLTKYNNAWNSLL